MTTAVELAAPAQVHLIERRERVFLLLAGIFICSMTLLNVVGITRFVELGPMSLAVGVLPYPLTFLCTDLVSELYGRERANFLVTVGLVLNGLILLVLFLGDNMPAATTAPSWQTLALAKDVTLPTGTVVAGSVDLFHLIYACTSGAMAASMVAYVAAQYADVRLFHFWRRVTKGRHLWVRNNFSTLISQGIDSLTVVSFTFGIAFLHGRIGLQGFLMLLGSNYLFKMLAALADTLPFYASVLWLRRYLDLADDEVHLASTPAVPGAGAAVPVAVPITSDNP